MGRTKNAGSQLQAKPESSTKQPASPPPPPPEKRTKSNPEHTTLEPGGQPSRGPRAKTSAKRKTVDDLLEDAVANPYRVVEHRVFSSAGVFRTLLQSEAWKPDNAAALRRLLGVLPSVQVLHRDSEGDTALMNAVRARDCSNVAALLEHCPEAQLLTADSSGGTALMAALTCIKAGTLGVVKELLARCPGPQVLAKDDDGCNALMYAFKDDNAEQLREDPKATLDVVKELLAHHPEVQREAMDKDGTTAEHLLERFVSNLSDGDGNPHMKELLQLLPTRAAA